VRYWNNLGNDIATLHEPASESHFENQNLKTADDIYKAVRKHRPLSSVIDSRLSYASVNFSKKVTSAYELYLFASDMYNRTHQK